MGYLVTSRHIGERILIGDDIEILISDINTATKRVDIAIKAHPRFLIKKLPRHIEERGHEFRYKNRPRNRQTD
jgi:sRNA-binding carbon storage regulator CsrA